MPPPAACSSSYVAPPARSENSSTRSPPNAGCVWQSTSPGHRAEPAAVELLDLVRRAAAGRACGRPTRCGRRGRADRRPRSRRRRRARARAAAGRRGRASPAARARESGGRPPRSRGRRRAGRSRAPAPRPPPRGSPRRGAARRPCPGSVVSTRSSRSAAVGRAVGEHDHAGVDRVADPDAAAVVDADPGRARRDVDERVQDRPVRDRVRPVAHRLGLAIRRRDRAGVEVVAADHDRRRHLAARARAR